MVMSGGLGNAGHKVRGAGFAMWNKVPGEILLRKWHLSEYLMEVTEQLLWMDIRWRTSQTEGTASAKVWEWTRKGTFEEQRGGEWQAGQQRRWEQRGNGALSETGATEEFWLEKWLYLVYLWFFFLIKEHHFSALVVKMSRGMLGRGQNNILKLQLIGF